MTFLYVPANEATHILGLIGPCVCPTSICCAPLHKYTVSKSIIFWTNCHHVIILRIMQWEWQAYDVEECDNLVACYRKSTKIVRSSPRPCLKSRLPTSWTWASALSAIQSKTSVMERFVCFPFFIFFACNSLQNIRHQQTSHDLEPSWPCISTSPEWHQPVSFIFGVCASSAAYLISTPGSDLSALWY